MENLDEIEYPFEQDGPSSNPFTGTFDVNIIRTHVITASLQPSSTGYGVHTEPPFFDIEQQNRSTVYRDTMMAVAICKKAKPITAKLFLYILYQLLKPGKDFIEIDFKLTQSRLDISRGSLYTGIAELTEFRVITRKRGRSQYWINPEYIFNGNRITYMELNAKDRIKVVHQRVVHR